jgi:hypothetical protein
MTFSDGLGTYLRLWTDGTWVYVGASMRLQTMLIGWIVYILVGWGIYRWRRAKRGVR